MDVTRAQRRRTDARPEGTGSLPTGNPILAKTPLLLLRFPGVLAAVAAAAAVLVTAAASGPLFVSAAESAVLEERIADVSRYSAGLRVAHSTLLHADGEPEAVRRELAELSESLEAALGPLPHLGSGVVSIIGDEADVTRGRRDVEARLVYRGGALGHVEVVRGTDDGGGVWLARTTAEWLGAGPGDTITVGTPAGTAEVIVSGVYRDLSTGSLEDFWRPLSNFIVSYDPEVPTPPPLMLASREVALDLSADLRMSGQFRWEYPLSEAPLTLPAARSLSGALSGIQSQIGDEASSLAGISQDFYETLLPSVVESAEDLSASVSGAVITLSLGGVVVALVVIALAGMFAVRRRGVEIRLLAARGAGPGLLGARAAGEALLPIVAGGALGWFAALALVGFLGPGDVIAGEALGSVLVKAGAALCIGVLVLGLVAGMSARSETGSSSRARDGARRVPWELPVLTLAAASLYEVTSRAVVPADDVTGAPHVDVLLLLFPILFVAAGSGLAARALGRLLPVLRRTDAASYPPSLYLAIRRLGAASRTVLSFVTASALAIGVFTYATLLSSSLEATANAKAQIFTGSEVSVTLNRSTGQVPDDLPFPATQVLRFPGEPLLPGDQDANVLAIDLDTFADVAFWDESFGGSSLDDVLAGLDSGGGEALPVIAAGEPVAAAPTLDHSGTKVPLRVVRQLDVFPGMTPGRPLVIADARALADAFAAAAASLETATRSDRLWARAGKAEVLDALRARDVSFAGTVTAEQVRAVPSFVVLSWIFGFLRGLGVAAGLVVLVGVVLYLGVRGRARVVAYALATRMGLTATGHGISVGVELAGMLFAAFVVGAPLGAAAAGVVLSRMDPLPETPPGAVFDVPPASLLAVALVLVLTAVIGAWVVQRRTGRTEIAEVLRASE